MVVIISKPENIYQNKTPVYEILSGASIALAALLLIIPGFATDFIGLLLIIPLTRKLILKRFVKKSNAKKESQINFIEGEFEDIGENDDKKIWTST